MKDQWNIKGIMNAMQKRIHDETEVAGEILLSEVKRQTPVDTGNLKSKNQKERIAFDKVRVFNNARQAAQREFGGVIKAGTGEKRAKYLTIPIHPMAKGKEAGDFDDLFFVKTGGKLFLAKKTGKTDRSIKFLFVLKKSVRQEATPYMRPGLDAAWPKIQEALR